MSIFLFLVGYLDVVEGRGEGSARRKSVNYPWMVTRSRNFHPVSLSLLLGRLLAGKAAEKKLYCCQISRRNSGGPKSRNEGAGREAKKPWVTEEVKQ